MKNKLNLTAATGIVVAVAALLSPLANAAWTSPTNSSAVTVVAQGASATKTSVAYSAPIVYTLASGQSLTANDTIEIALTGGLAFSSTSPTLTPSKGDLGGGNASAVAPLSGGATGATSALWRVVQDIETGDTVTLNANQSIFNVSGISAGSTADIQITLKTSTGLTIGTASQSLASQANSSLYTGVNLFTSAVTTASDTAQVITSYKFYDTAGTDKTSSLSTVALTNNSTGTSIPTAAIPALDLLYTITGNMAGIAKIDATGLSGATATCTASSPAVTNGFAVDTTNGVARACNTAALASGGADFSVSDIEFNLDGTTSQAARAFTVSVALLASTNWTAYTIQDNTTLYSIARNGSFFTTNSTGNLNNIKITDQSGTLPTGGGSISVTAWDVNGMAVTQTAGAPALPATVPSNGTVTIKGSDLRANYVGAVRFDFTVNSSDINVSNVKQSSDGVNVNVYRNSATGGSL